MSSGPTKRQSWKQAKQKTPKQGPNRPARWLLTLLAIGLLAVLLPLLRDVFWNKTMPTHVVAMQSGQSRAGLPSLPHSANDLRPMAEIDWPYYAFEDQSALLQSNQSLAVLSEHGIDESGALIVYVCAHGVTNITAAGSADILCRDYDLAAPLQSVFKVSTYLEELKKTKARTKLLVFDSGTIISDPRLGMLVNDFPRRVIELVEQWDDPGLWVMLSHATFQTPLIAGEQDLSLFGTAFVEGLLGQADREDRGGNQDNDVTLEELYRYVVARCDKISAGRQKPLLLRAGTPINQQFEVTDVPLLAISVTKTPDDAEAAGDEAATSDAADAQAPADQSTESQVAGDATKPAVTAEVDAPAEQEKTPQANAVADGAASETEKAGGQSPASGAVPDLLIQAWRLRDQIESRALTQGWAPQEYAPHLWRQLLDYLVQFDLRRSSSDDPFELNLTQHVLGLKDLQVYLQNPNQSVSTDRGGLIVNDLLRASKSFLTGNASRRFETDSPKLREVADAVREVRKIAFLMPYYVRWHANAGLVGVAEDTVAGRIGPLLEKLIDFERHDYGPLRGKRLPALVDIVKTQRDITQSFTDLSRYLRQHIADVCEPQRSLELKARALLQARALLAGPLPTAHEREQLTKVVHSFDFSEEPTSEQAQRVELPQLDDVDRRNDLVRQLQLEQAVIELQEMQRQPLSLSPELDNLAEIGARLKAFYQKATTELTGGTPANSTGLLLVDGRDAKRIGWRDELAISLGIDPPYIQPVLSIDATPDVLELSEGKPQILKLRVSSDQGSSSQGRITFSVDPRIDFRPLGGTGFRLDQSSELSFRVIAKPGYGGVRQRVEPIVFTASVVGHVDGKQEIQTWLAGPDRVDLVVRQVNDVAETPGNHGALLRTFPNRTTPFRFAVRNPSNTEKTVVASLYQVPLSLAKQVASGRLFSRTGRVLTVVEQATLSAGLPKDGLQRIATSKPITLSPSAPPEPLDFSPQPPPPPAAGQENTDTQPAPSATPADKPDVSQGILCEIREQKPGGEAWLTWIEFRTVPPRDYVNTVIHYDLAKLSIKCSLTPGMEIPGIAEKPIPIDWDLSELSGEVRAAIGGSITTDSVKSQANPAELIHAEMEPLDDRVMTVYLNVDNYPRALAFEVKLDEDDTYSVPRRDRSDIRLISAGMTGHPKKYVTSPAFLPEKPDDKNPVVVLANRERDKAAFPAAKRGSRLELRFQVDAPVIAFGRDSPDKLTLRLDTPGFDPITLFGDRESKFQVEEVGADGLVRIHNPVTDYVKSIDLPEVRGTYELVAQLTTADDDENDWILLAFDDSPPRLTMFQAPPKIQLNTALPLSLIVDDESGLETVEYGIVDEPSATPAKMTPIPVPPRETILLPTKGLEADQPYYLKLRLVDRAGNEMVTDGKRGAPPPLAFYLFKPAPAVGPAAGGVQPGTIKGKVALGRYGPPRITVELTGGKRFSPFQTKTGGNFEFKNVPAGDYVLKASGNPLNRGIHVGEAEISIKKQEDFSQPVTINLEPKKD